MSRMRLLCLPLAVVAVLAFLISETALGATRGSVTGRVTDSASGAPLSGVNVLLEPAGLKTVSADNGSYTFINVSPGVYKVSARLVGYAPAQIETVNVVMDLPARVDIKLSATVEEEPEVVVVQDQLLTSPESTQNLYVRTGEDQLLTRSQPNSFYQVPSLVSSAPGIVQDASGALHIRGGRDDQIGWMVEGIPVINPIDNTFGTNLVTVGMSRMEIYTGGYQAEYGNAISGVLNEIKRTGSETRGGNLELTLGSQQHAGLYVEAGNVTPTGLDWYLGNYSWRSDFLRDIAMNAKSTDSVLKLVRDVSARDKITVLGMEGSAQYGLHPIYPLEYQDQARTNQGYGLGSFTWNHQMSPEAYFIVRPYYFMSKNDIRALATQLTDSATSRSVQRGLQAEVVKQFGDRHQMRAGVWNIHSSNSFRRFIPNLALMMTGDPDLSAMLDPFEYVSQVPTRQLALFAQDSMRLSDSLVLDAGVRYDRMKYSKQLSGESADSQVSPRLGLVFSKDPRSVLRASYGRFIQFTPTSVLDRQFTNPNWEMIYTADADLDPERATSYEVGWERQVNDQTLFRLTPFYRKYTDLINRVPLDPDDPYSPQTFANADRAQSKGLEMYLERTIGRGLKGWLSYTLSKTRQKTDGDPAGWTNVYWDQRHTADATLLYSNGMSDYTMRLQYGSGLPWTHMEDEAMYGRRLPDLFVVTLGMTRRLTADPRDGSLTFTVYNLLNTATVTERDYEGSPTSYLQPRFIGVSYSAPL